MVRQKDQTQTHFAPQQNTFARTGQALTTLEHFIEPVSLIQSERKFIYKTRKLESQGMASLGFWKDLPISAAPLLKLRKHTVSCLNERSSCNLKDIERDSGIALIDHCPPATGSLFSKQLGLRSGLTEHLLTASSRLEMKERLCKYLKSSSRQSAAYLRDCILQAAAEDAERLVEADCLNLLQDFLQTRHYPNAGMPAVQEYLQANLNLQSGHGFQSNIFKTSLPSSVCLKVRSHLKSTRNVLLLHNIKEALGDEWIRNAYLLAALLHSHPALRIWIISNKPFLYNHPRIIVIDPGDEDRQSQLLKQQKFDLIFSQNYLADPLFTTPVELEDHYKNKETLVFKTVAGSNFFDCGYWTAGFAGKDFLLKDEISGLINPYDYSLRLINWLGLQYQRPLMVGRTLLQNGNSKELQCWWEQEIHNNPATRQRRLLLFSPFGGTYAGKGFTAAEDYLLLEELCRLIHLGYYILILPNASSWGDRNRAVQLKDLLPKNLKRYVCTRVPAANEQVFFQAQLMQKVDNFYGVVGGGAHLALSSCANTRILNFDQTGGALDWLPLLREPGQSSEIPYSIWRQRCVR